MQCACNAPICTIVAERLSLPHNTEHCVRPWPRADSIGTCGYWKGYWTDNYLQSSSTGCSLCTKMRLTILHSTSRHFIFYTSRGEEEEPASTRRSTRHDDYKLIRALKVSHHSSRLLSSGSMYPTLALKFIQQFNHPICAHFSRERSTSCMRLRAFFPLSLCELPANDEDGDGLKQSSSTMSNSKESCESQAILCSSRSARNVNLE